MATAGKSGQLRTQLGLLRPRLRSSLNVASTLLQTPHDISALDTSTLEGHLLDTTELGNKLRNYEHQFTSCINEWQSLIKKDPDEEKRKKEYFEKYGEFPLNELASILDSLQKFRALCQEEISARIANKTYVASESSPVALTTSSPQSQPSQTPAPQILSQSVPMQLNPLFSSTAQFTRSTFLDHTAPNIKPFSGMRTEYHDFRSLFSTLYGNHPALSPVQKLCALKNLLRGEPYQLISSLPLTASNFDVALSTLDQLYGRTRPLLQSLHQQLLELQPTHPNERNSHKILSVYIKVFSLVQQIQNAGLNPTDSQTLGMTVRTKFPRWINSKLQSREKNEVLSMEQVLSEIRIIIEEEAIVDELYQQSITEKTMFTSSPSHHRNQNHNNNPRANPAHHSNFNQQRTNFNQSRTDYQRTGPMSRAHNATCPFCANPHRPSECSLSIPQRQEQVRTKQLCYNCLGPHPVKECPSRISCRQCGRRHHSALHATPATFSQPPRNTYPAPAVNHSSPRHGSGRTDAPRDPRQHQGNRQPSGRSWIPPRTMQTHYVNEQPVADPQLNYTTFVPNSTTSLPFAQLDSTHNCNQTNTTEPTPLQCIEVQAHNPANPELQNKLLVFFDSGSTRSYITTAAAQKLQLPITNETELHVNTFANDDTKTITSTHHDLLLDSLTDTQVPITVLAIPQLTKSIPTVLVTPMWHPISTELEQLEYVSRTPDILIGSDLLWTLWDIGGPNFYTEDIGNGFTILNTLLGPIATRKRLLNAVLRQPHNDVCMTALTTLSSPDDPLLQQVQNLFDNSLIQDEPDNFDKNRPDDHPAMKFVMSTLLQDPVDGRYLIRFPVQDPPLRIPDMRPLAVRKQMFVFRELKKRPDLELKYFGYFNELIRDDVIEAVPHDELVNPERTVCYISHFGVFKDSATTSARPVFNATEHIKGYDSLNAQLDPGPCLLRPLHELLLDIRCFPKIISGDIKRAFLQLGLQTDDKDLFRFLLPKNPEQPPSAHNLIDMRFRRMPFGPTSSPFLLQSVIRLHLEHNELELAQEIAKHIYVDNIFLPFTNTAEALQKHEQTKDIFNSCAMTVREWWSNDPTVKAQLQLLEGQVQPAKKILGLHYDHQLDMFSVKPAPVPDISHGWTKRQLLAFLGSTFDPLGFLCPVITTLKLHFQDALRQKLSLDERLAEDNIRGLTNFLRTWTTEPLFVPRKVTESPELGHELHIFSDASGRAAATCAYLKNAATQEPQFICASSKLAPPHGMTIPRLELVGVVLASKLAKKLFSTLPVRIDKVFLWTDSSVALHWVSGQSSSDKEQFVRNRVNTIHDNLKDTPHEIRHIAGTENPADLPSRGCNHQELQKNWNTWMHGPEWLQRPATEWPQSLTSDNLPALSAEQQEYAALAIDRPPKKDSCLDTLFPSTLNTRFSSLDKVIRTISFLLMFLQTIRPRLHIFNKAPDTLHKRSIFNFQFHNPLLTSMAELILILRAQHDHPPSQREQMEYNIFEQPEAFGNVLRCKPRTSSNLPDSYNRRFPIYLSRHSPIVKLIIMHFHCNERHAGTTHTLTAIRQHFWIPKLRQLIKTTLRNECYHCRRLQSPYRLPNFDPLPAERLTRAKYPFETTGLDYAGPYQVRDNGSWIKVWVCLFTCLTTRAVHCEMVLSLSAIDFLRALRRFGAQFGFPTKIILDNQTAFHLAAKIIDRPQFVNNFGVRTVTSFKFITPHSPWEGGIYERMIAIFKQCLRHSFTRKPLTAEEFRTTLPEICCVLNRRPLHGISSADMDFLVLRPIDFVFPTAGRLELPLFDAVDHDDDNWEPEPATIQCQVERWLAQSQLLVNHFWDEFSTNYVSALQERWQRIHNKQHGTQNVSPKVNDVVLLVDRNRPRHDWPLAKIVKLQQNNRTATVQASGKTYLRPICELIPLETTPRSATSEQNRDQQQPSASAQQGHPMVTRSKTRLLSTTITTALFLAALFTSSTATQCSNNIKKILFIPPCATHTIAIAETNTSPCYFPINCPHGHTKQQQEKDAPSSYCGPYCSCPPWSNGCVHLLPITVHPPDPVIESQLATLRPTEICSFTRNDKLCSRISVTKTFPQISLPSGAIYAVDHIQISVPDYDANGPIVCYDSTTDELHLTLQSEIEPSTVTGTARLCTHVTCSSEASQFCFFPPSPALLQGSDFSIPIAAWGSTTYTYYPHRAMNVTVDPEFYATCIDQKLVIYIVDHENNPADQYHIDICYDNLCTTNPVPSTSLHVKLPTLPVGSSLTTHLWTSEKLTSSVNVTCKSICDANCLWCWYHLKHPQCLTTYEWIEVSLVLCFIAILIHIVSHVCNIFHKIAFFIYFFIHILRCIIRFLSRPLRAIHVRFFPQRRRWTPLPLLTTVVFWILLSPRINACSTTISFDATSSTCTQMNNVLKCKTDGATILNLHANKAEACLTITENNNFTLGVLSLRVEHFECLCNKDTLYFTRDHALNVQSSHRCSGSGSCDDNDYCKEIKPDTIIPEFTGDARTRPGFTSCYSDCGCVTCGCFYCSSSCVFSRIYATPTTSTVYEIFRCPTWTTRITLHATLQYNNIETTTVFTVIPGQQYTLPNIPISISILSSSIPPTPILGTDFITDGKRTAFATVNPPNHFTGGTIGQLQCSSSLSAHAFKCSFRPQVCSCSQASHSLLCACPSGSVTDHLSNYLPTTMQNVEFVPHEGTIAARLPMTQLQTQVTFAGLQLSVIRPTATCNVTPLKLQGCFSCGEGATLDYECTTTDNTETTAISQCGISIATMKCGPNKQTHRTRYSFTSSLISINCSLNCGIPSYFSLEGRLQEKLIDNEIPLKHIIVEEMVQNEFNWKSPLNSLSNLMQTSLTNLFLSPVIYICIVIGLLFVFTRLMKWNISKAKAT